MIRQIPLGASVGWIAVDMCWMLRAITGPGGPNPEMDLLALGCNICLLMITMMTMVLEPEPSAMQRGT